MERTRNKSHGGGSSHAEIFNTLAENEVYLNETKITTNQVQEATVMSETSATRENLTEQDTVMGAFGKIRKWFCRFASIGIQGYGSNTRSSVILITRR